jgi:hypothetical protein
MCAVPLALSESSRVAPESEFTVASFLAVTAPNGHLQSQLGVGCQWWFIWSTVRSALIYSNPEALKAPKSRARIQRVSWQKANTRPLYSLKLKLRGLRNPPWEPLYGWTDRASSTLYPLIAESYVWEPLYSWPFSCTGTLDHYPTLGHYTKVHSRAPQRPLPVLWRRAYAQWPWDIWNFVSTFRRGLRIWEACGMRAVALYSISFVRVCW